MNRSWTLLGSDSLDETNRLPYTIRWRRFFMARFRIVLRALGVALLLYMLIVGGQSVLDDPNIDTLWLSVIGAALLTFIVYQTTKK